MTNSLNWKPQGIASVESNAMKAITHTGHTAVIAGPGAGKTELLSQKALFLLESNICPSPKKILALTFKKDAAKNLSERIKKRNEELAFRIDSLTYDSFAKGILDRFMLGLTPNWKPSKGYKISTLGFNEANSILSEIIIPEELNALSFNPWDRMQFQEFSKRYMYANPLVECGVSLDNPNIWLAYQIFHHMLQKSKPSTLEFPLISRLAELLFRLNPKIHRALNLTYSHVFLDEFQDTTHIQFELIKTGFSKSNCSVTAVGDHKQRIMGWAMAMENAFEEFGKYFPCENIELTMNYRSSENLVSVQRLFANILDPQNNPQKPFREDGKGTCLSLVFPNEAVEAENVAKKIRSLVTTEKVNPRDICILVKQRPSSYTLDIINETKKIGIPARIEEPYQDLLKDELISFLISTIKLCSTRQAKAIWNDCIDFLKRFYGLDEVNDVDEMIESFSLLGYKVRNKVSLAEKNKLSSLEIFKEIINFLGEKMIMNAFPHFNSIEYFREYIVSFSNLFDRSLSNCNFEFQKASYDFQGDNSVPIMTIHKSKGLEFNTVFFIGLEDSAFWTFKNQRKEDTSAFFVALSRAMERVYFTFCERRDGRSQKRIDIGELYNMLKNANVPEKRIGF